MKKSISLICVLLMSVSLFTLMTACGDNSQSEFVPANLYQSTLKNVLDNNILPDGLQLASSDIGDEKYALCDVNGDGTKELLISVEHATEGEIVIYEIKDDSVTRIGSVGSGSTFYDCGVIYSPEKNKSADLHFSLYRVQEGKFEKYCTVKGKTTDNGMIYTVAGEDFKKPLKLDNEEYNVWYNNLITGSMINPEFSELTVDNIRNAE